MRIVLLPLGTRGDVQPLVALGLGLQARGHTVRVCTSPDFGPWIQGLGLDFRPVGRTVNEVIQANADGIANPWRFVRLVETFLDEAFASIPGVVGEPDMLVGSGVQLVGPTLAERLGIPYRFVLYCPQLLRSRAYPPVFVPRLDLPPALNHVLWAFANRLGNGVLRRVNQHRQRLGLAPAASDTERYLCGQRAVLAADPELAPLPDDVGTACDTTGFLALPGSGEGGLSGPLEAFLAQGPPPVYVGFGSMPAPEAARKTHAIVQAVRSVGARALISGGWGGLGEGALPPGCLRLGPVSHELLLPRCAAAVHHGGAGTTTTAARAGVPQIVVPHGVDQYYWADRVHRLGVGTEALSHEDFAAQPLADALARVLGDRDVQARARALGQRIRARDGVAATARVLEACVAGATAATA